MVGSYPLLVGWVKPPPPPFSTFSDTAQYSTQYKIQNTETDIIWAYNFGFYLDGRSSHMNDAILRIMHSNRCSFKHRRKPRVSMKFLNRMQRMKYGNRNQTFKVSHWNAGSRLWQNKLLEIQLVLDSRKSDLLFVSEANLWLNVPDHDKQIIGHKLLVPKAMSNVHHARLVLIVKEDLEIELLEDYMDAEAATIWVRLGPNRRNSILVGGIYREHRVLGRTLPNATRLEMMEEQQIRWRRIVEKWSRAGRTSKCIVIGDLNLDMRRWQNPDQYVSNMVELVQDKIEQEGFVQLVQEHTRSWHGQADSLLDHIWVNCPNMVQSHHNILNGASDHNIVEVVISCKNIVQGGFNIKKRLWKNFNKQRCEEKFKAMNWNDILNEDNVNIANSLLEEKIIKIIESEAPMSIVQSRTRYCSWLSQQTKDKMLARDTLKDIARRTQLQSDWNEYKTARNECTRAQRKDKSNSDREAFKKFEEERDTGKIFGMTRKLLGWTRSGPPTMLVKNGTPYRKQKDLANIQVAYYKEKVDNIKDTIPRVNWDPLFYLREALKKWQPEQPVPVFKFRQVQMSEVLKIISNLKNSHAFGHDGIDAITVKMFAKHLVPVMTHVINLSLGTKCFPAKWKISRVIPLLKSNDADRNNPASFRPVAQLSLTSKVTEKCAQIQLIDFLESSGQLSSDHHTYRAHLSTSTAMIQIMDTIGDALDANEIAATMSIDQSAAFDCVEHALLLKKLKFYNLDDDCLQWIQSYLEHRSMYVSIGSADSMMISTKHGVPQGSVLGPLLYLLFINDFPQVIKDDICEHPSHLEDKILFGANCNECGTLTLYADDGLYISISPSRMTNQRRIEENFVRIKDYLNAHGLQINQGKTMLTEMMTKQKRTRLAGIPPELTAQELIKGKWQDKHITDSPVCRLLGANIKNNLSWDSHLSSGKKALLPALRRQIGALYRLKHAMSRKAKLQVVNALVLSRLSYLINIWGNSSDNTSKKAQRVQNLAARFITGNEEDNQGVNSPSKL